MNQSFQPASPRPENHFKSDVVLKNGTDYAPDRLPVVSRCRNGCMSMMPEWCACSESPGSLEPTRRRPLKSETTGRCESPTPRSLHLYGHCPAVTLTTTDSYANAITRDSKHVDILHRRPGLSDPERAMGSSPQSGGNRDATGYATGWRWVKLNSTIAVEAPNGPADRHHARNLQPATVIPSGNGEKYAGDSPGVILTVATIDIASKSVGRLAECGFSMAIPYPTNYSATANAHDRQLYQSLGTWWFQYSFRA